MNMISRIMGAASAVALIMPLSNQVVAYEQNCYLSNSYENSKCVKVDNQIYHKSCVFYRLNNIPALSIDSSFWINLESDRVYSLGYPGGFAITTSEERRDFLANEQHRTEGCFQFGYGDFFWPVSDYERTYFNSNVIEVGTFPNAVNFQVDTNCKAGDGRTYTVLEYDSWESVEGVASNQQCYLRGSKLQIDESKLGTRTSPIPEPYITDGFNVKTGLLINPMEEGWNYEAWAWGWSKANYAAGISVKSPQGAIVATLAADGSPVNYLQETRYAISRNGRINDIDSVETPQSVKVIEVSSSLSNRLRIQQILVFGGPESWTNTSAREFLVNTGYEGSFYPKPVYAREIDKEEVYLGIGERLYLIHNSFDGGRFAYKIEALSPGGLVLGTHVIKQSQMPYRGNWTIQIDN